MPTENDSNARVAMTVDSPLVTLGQAKPSLQIEIVSDLLELALADEKVGEKAHACMRAYPKSLKIFM